MKDILRITAAVLTFFGVCYAFSQAAIFASISGILTTLLLLGISGLELSQLARYIWNAARHKKREEKRYTTGFYDNVKDPVSNALFQKEHDRYDDEEMANTFGGSYRPAPLKKNSVSKILFMLSGILSAISLGMYITAASLFSNWLFFLYVFTMPYGIVQLLNTILMVDASLNLSDVPAETNVPASSLDQRMEEEIHQDIEAKDALSPEELTDLLQNTSSYKKQNKPN